MSILKRTLIINKMAKKVGRPSKIGKVLEVAEKILFNKDLMLLTDEEFVFLINEELEDKDKISDRTFARWKVKDFDESDDIGRSFVILIKRALLTQKENLFKKFANDDRAWQRWAWIIERKFSEWNLKQISENFNKVEAIVKEEIDYSKLDGETLKNIIEQLKSDKGTK
jgi:hypothetical protein